ncbi:hypothetical protein MTO96_051347, partial [Rhipicephalus appendiculatus]
FVLEVCLPGCKVSSDDKERQPKQRETLSLLQAWYIELTGAVTRIRMTDLLHQGRRHLAVSAWKPLLEPSLDFPWRHRKERPRPAFCADTQAQSSGKESAAERSGSWSID